jgi:uncharacterized protein YcnI
MSAPRRLTRTAALAVAVGLATLACAGTASAHVTADPEQAEQGGYAKIAFRVPNERPDSGTVKLTVTLPADHPLTSMRTKPVPGWTAQVQKARLDHPVEVEGTQVTEAVRSITWTAQPGTRIGPDEFAEFEVSMGKLPTDTRQLVFPTDQTYESGEVVSWNAPPPAEGAEEPEHPAPSVTLVPEPESGHGHGPGHRHGEEKHANHGADNTARWLGGAGLVVGALGLGIGVGALVRSRKSRP